MIRRTAAALAAAAAVLALAGPASASPRDTPGCRAAGRQLLAAGFPSYSCDGDRALSGAFWIAYQWQPQYMIEGTGLGRVAQLARAFRQLYQAEANPSHWWRFHEQDDHGRCLEHLRALVMTRDCNASGVDQFFFPQSTSSGYVFRWPGQRYVMSFREPPSNGRTIYMHASGASGYGQHWQLVFPS